MANPPVTRATPRWLYRFIDWSNSTPIQIWGVAIVFYIASGGLLHLARYLFEAGSPQFDAGLFFPGIYFTILISFWHWTNLLAHSFLETFGRGVGKRTAEIKRIHTDFISLSERQSAVLFILGIFLAIFYAQDFIRQFGFTQLASMVALFLVALPASVLQLYSMFRILVQLVKLTELYNEIKDINLFNLKPVYALSRYSYSYAFIGMLTVVLIDSVSLLQHESIDWANHILSLGLVLVLLVAPTLGIGRRLRAEKDKDLQYLGNQLNSLYDETSLMVKRRKLATIPQLNSAAMALERQIEKVQKIPTWPWNPGSLRNLFIPVLLPLLIAILQRYALTLLGF